MDSSTWCFVVIYIGYCSAVDYLYWDVKSISEFDYEESSTPMGPSGPCSKLIFIDGTVYEG